MHTYIHTYTLHSYIFIAYSEGKNYMEDLKADDDAVARIHLFRAAHWPLVCTQQ
jgi:hypothetical protein